MQKYFLNWIIFYFITFIPNYSKGMSIDEVRVVTSYVRPFIVQNENGEISGVVIDRVKTLFNMLKINPKIEPYPWIRAINMCNKSPGMIIFPIAKTKEREENLEYVGAIYNSRSYFYKLRANEKQITITKLSDAKKYSIGVKRDDIRGYYLAKNNFQGLEISKNSNTLVRKLLGKRVDIILSSKEFVSAQLAEIGVDENSVVPIYEVKGIDPGRYLALNKNTPKEIIEKFRNALKKLPPLEF